jgi:hypothetical protein
MAPFSDDQDSEWTRKGATLSDKTARREFGLSPEELAQAFKAGKLQARRTWIYGNPAVRLLRREVEALVKSRRGGASLKGQQAKKELAEVNRELKRLKKQVVALEERRSKLMISTRETKR